MSGVISTLAQIGRPDGLDVSRTGRSSWWTGRTIASSTSLPPGTRIGFVGPVFSTAYDVEAAPGGVTYVLEAGPAGRIRRVAADGTVTTVSRKR